MDGGGGGSGDRGTLGELDVDEALGLPGGRAGGTAKLLRTTWGLAGGEGAEVRGGGGGGIGLCGELFDRVRPVVTDGTSEAWILGETPDATEGGAGGGGGGGGDEAVLEEGVGNARPGIGGALKFLGNVLWMADLLIAGGGGGDDEPRPVSTAAPLVFRSVGMPLAKSPPNWGPLGAAGGAAGGADAGVDGKDAIPGIGGLAIPPPPPVGAVGLDAMRLVSLFVFVVVTLHTYERLQELIYHLSLSF